MVLEFNRKSYTIPSDLKEYLNVLNLAEELQNNLCVTFMQKALDPESKVVSPDEMDDYFKEAAEKFIQKLCEKGVYDKTIDDYTFQNEGYIEFLSITKDAMQAMVKFLSEEAQDYEKGRYAAEQKALSNVTGSGVSAYSSSILTLALTSAVEYTTLQGQCNKADEQYAKELKRLREQGASEREIKENKYFATQYCPNAKAALEKFTYCLMGRYIDDLITEKNFDKETLQYVDIKRSQEILKNLKISSNKEAVLEKAFLACPFNMEVYVELGRLGELDIETFETAKQLEQAEYVEQKLYALFQDVSYTGNLYADLASVENVVTSLAHVTGNAKAEFYKEFAKPIRDKIIKNYKSIQDYSCDADACKALLEKFNDKILEYSSSDLQSIAESEVSSVVSDREFNALITKCGYDNLLIEISAENLEFSGKHDLDDYYIKRIYDNLVQILPEQQEKVLEKRKKAESDKAKKLNKAKKGKSKSLVQLVAFLIIPVFALVSISFLWEASVKSSVKNHIQKKIDGKHNNGWGYWVNIGGVDGFEIEKMEYVKTPTSIYITPKIVYNVGSNSATVSDAEWVIDDFYRDYWGSVPFYISIGSNFLNMWTGETTIRCPNGKEISIEQRSAEYIKKEGTRFNPYFTMPMIVFYVIYAIVVSAFMWLKIDFYNSQIKKYS